MTKEERETICKLLRKETACGMMTASKAIDKLINVLKQQPPIIMDNPSKLEISWVEPDRNLTQSI